MKHRRFFTCFKVKKGIHGLGIFTTRQVKKGNVLFKMSGPILNYPTRTSVQIGKDQHIEHVIASHVNHSCIPNARVDRKTRSFISLRNIQKGEEITFDYNKNEEILASPFMCKCCGRFMMGKKFAALKLQKELV